MFLTLKFCRKMHMNECELGGHVTHYGRGINTTMPSS